VELICLTDRKDQALTETEQVPRKEKGCAPPLGFDTGILELQRLDQEHDQPDYQRIVIGTMYMAN
jgi:hypothetical protein